ncbi:response regulator transcription factor [Sinomonas humi]|uniref:response regulator transcription factor n=1 Tax=Sinomonas humi TaxID=1338436 RepID=UPI00068EDE28|nr:helix-turn-helix transcriptional regulator [Sinomonas humi]
MDPSADLAAQLNHLPDRGTYLKAASDMLAAIFPSNVVSRVSLDVSEHASEIRSYPNDHPFGKQADRLIDVYADHPMRISFLDDSLPDVWRPRRISDVASDLKFFRTRAFQEGLRVHETNRELAFLCSWSSHSSYAGWGINRWNVDFTDQEVELAAHIQPMLRLLDTAYRDPVPLSEGTAQAERYAVTPRELEILQLVGKGLTGVAVGHLLGISPRTVAKHLEHAYAKLGCTNRIDALRVLRGSDGTRWTSRRS